MNAQNEQRTAEQLVERIAEILGNWGNPLCHYSGNQEASELLLSAESVANSEGLNREQLVSKINDYYKGVPRLISPSDPYVRNVKPELLVEFNLCRQDLCRMANAVPPTLTIPAFFEKMIRLSRASETGNLVHRLYHFLSRYKLINEVEVKEAISRAYPVGVPKEVVQKRPALGMSEEQKKKLQEREG